MTTAELDRPFVVRGNRRRDFSITNPAKPLVFYGVDDFKNDASDPFSFGDEPTHLAIFEALPKFVAKGHAFFGGGLIGDPLSFENTTAAPADALLEAWAKVLAAQVQDVYLSEVGESAAPSAQGAREEYAGISSALQMADIEHAAARLRKFKKFEDDWDGEGAPAPDESLIDSALRLLQRLQPWHPRPTATLDEFGSPLFEFWNDDNRLLGTVRFISPSDVEVFAVDGDNAYLEEGVLDSEIILRFLSDKLQITLQP